MLAVRPGFIQSRARILAIAHLIGNAFACVLIIFTFADENFLRCIAAVFAFAACLFWLFPVRQGRLPVKVFIFSGVTIAVMFLLELLFFNRHLVDVMMLVSFSVWEALLLIFGYAYFMGAFCIFLIKKFWRLSDLDVIDHDEKERKYLREFNHQGSVVFQKLMKSEFKIFEALMMILLALWALLHWGIIRIP